MKKLIIFCVVATLMISLFSCNENVKKEETAETDTIAKEVNTFKTKTEQFVTVKLTTDLSVLSENQKKMLPLLFEAAKIMNDIFWTEAYGDKNELLNSLNDENEKKFAMINYGPWERLNGNEPFIDTYDAKPKGAQFYPVDMTVDEFKSFENKDKESLYTLIRRDESGKLKVIWYHEAYKKQYEKVAELLNKAAELAEDKGFKKYLTLRAKALLTDDYLASDMAWMSMKNNTIDFVVGPIENYEDGLFGYKTAHEAFILIKDKKWSEKLAKYAKMLPKMQKSLPVPAKYKSEKPGSKSDLGAYDAIYYAGDCNAGSKTIAINLPNDERVHLKKGSRRLQLKNTMLAKFDNILLPISKILINKEQRKHITFEAFFENTMFHETAHGLGIKNTINGKGTARKALKDVYSTIEEGKADILGLYFVTKLFDQGDFPEKDLMDNYVTFMASIFRSVRFGVASSHGKANMLRFYYFKEMGAFIKNEETGTYKIDMKKMREAMTSLSEKILVLQGDGNYDDAKKWVTEKAVINQDLKSDLDKVNDAGIPVDIIFEQGLEAIGY